MFEQHIKIVDIVLEIVDARAPLISRDNLLVNQTRNKKTILILNKADLAAEKTTEKWLRYFREQGETAISFTHNRKKSVSLLKDCLKKESQSAIGKRFNRPLRVMVAGIPNVGKSTVLNVLVGRRAARTGDRPGITRGPQWVRIQQGLELLDTPGVLKPTIHREALLPLGVLGCIPESRWDMEDAAGWLLEKMADADYAGLEKVFPGLSSFKPEECLRQYAVRRGMLERGGEPDFFRASRSFIKEYRDGLPEQFSLEEPDI